MENVNEETVLPLKNNPIILTLYICHGSKSFLEMAESNCLYVAPLRWMLS